MVIMVKNIASRFTQMILPVSFLKNSFMVIASTRVNSGIKDTNKNKKEARASLLLSISFGKRRSWLICRAFHRIR